MNENEGVQECIIITLALRDRIVGMLMHFWGLVKDDEIRKSVHDTIQRLQVAEEEDE